MLRGAVLMHAQAVFAAGSSYCKQPCSHACGTHSKVQAQQSFFIRGGAITFCVAWMRRWCRAEEVWRGLHVVIKFQLVPPTQQGGFSVLSSGLVQPVLVLCTVIL